MASGTGWCCRRLRARQVGACRWRGAQHCFRQRGWVLPAGVTDAGPECCTPAGRQGPAAYLPFQPGADSAEAAQRLVGARAARAFGLLPAAEPEGGVRPAAVASSPDLLQAARQLRTEALKQLLNMFGVGQSERGMVRGWGSAVHMHPCTLSSWLGAAGCHRGSFFSGAAHGEVRWACMTRGHYVPGTLCASKCARDASLLPVLLSPQSTILRQQALRSAILWQACSMRSPD